MDIFTAIKKSYRRAAFIALCAFALITCYDRETLTHSGALLTDVPDSAETLSLDGRFFVLLPGDTTRLYGLRQCTTMINDHMASADEDSLYYRTITGEKTVQKLGNTEYNVYPRLMEWSGALDAGDIRTARQYFQLNQNETLQRAFSANGELYPMENDTTVMPHILTLNNPWNVPLIVQPSVLPLGENIAIYGTAVVMEIDQSVQLAGTWDNDGMLLQLLYYFSGEHFEGDMANRVSGTITARQYYYKGIGLYEQEMFTHVETRSLSGTITVQKEHVILERRDETYSRLPDQLFDLD